MFTLKLNANEEHTNNYHVNTTTNTHARDYYSKLFLAEYNTGSGVRAYTVRYGFYSTAMGLSVLKLQRHTRWGEGE